MSAASLFAALEAAGARLALSEDGEGLTLSGKRPPAALLEAVRAERAALLAHLRGAAKEEAAPAPASSSPDVAPWAALPPAQERRGPPRPDWGALSARPGHCGSCARWEEAPDWGPLMGVCGCPPAAWPGGLPPLAIHAGHRCAAYREEGEEVGRGYRAKGQAPAPRPRPRRVAP
ncbi:hypothetical protein [Deinococcus sp. YIM 77859]|uniref:hypothetical protein n=1 Tax=Deinococcus sp. YIM 77859 TaxID=1540221 RepID=UPI0005516DCC|nr:hypothetical protein [Deinococcus sp. YIM 77859]